MQLKVFSILRIGRGDDLYRGHRLRHALIIKLCSMQQVLLEVWPFTVNLSLFSRHFGCHWINARKPTLHNETKTARKNFSPKVMSFSVFETVLIWHFFGFMNHREIIVRTTTWDKIRQINKCFLMWSGRNYIYLQIHTFLLHTGDVYACRL